MTRTGPIQLTPKYSPSISPSQRLLHDLHPSHRMQLLSKISHEHRALMTHTLVLALSDVTPTWYHFKAYRLLSASENRWNENVKSMERALYSIKFQLHLPFFILNGTPSWMLAAYDYFVFEPGQGTFSSSFLRWENLIPCHRVSWLAHLSSDRSLSSSRTSSFLSLLWLSLLPQKRER